MVAIVIVLGMWGAEQIGLLSRTIYVDQGALVLRAPLDGIEDFPVLPMMALYVVTTLWTAAMIAGAVARARDASSERLQRQAWQLRQLL